MNVVYKSIGGRNRKRGFWRQVGGEMQLDGRLGTRKGVYRWWIGDYGLSAKYLFYGTVVILYKY